MLTLTQTRLKGFILSLIAIPAMSIAVSALVPQSTVHAADYPSTWCTFKQSGDKKTLTASCTDDGDNGTFNSVVFNESGKDTYSFTDSYWSWDGGNVPVTTHDEPKELSGYEHVKCKPAVIKVLENEASISGEYASVKVLSGALSTWTCTELLAGKVTVNRDVVRLAVWRNTFYKRVLENMPAIECKRFKEGSSNYKQCASGVAQSVTLCIGSNGSVWKSTMSYTDEAEQKEAYKKATVACLDGKLSAATKAEITKVVNDAKSHADSEEEKIVDTEGDERKEEEDTAPTCAIDGLGWIICPAMTMLGTLNDAAFGILNNFLEIKPSLITDKATFSAWERFRDFANVAFVIAFMIIVYSQITSVGLSNYGVKKLLPKIFVAAILVNISYWICAIAIDLSNIVGASIYDLFKSLVNGVGGGGGTGLDDQIGGLWSTVIGYALAGTAGALLVVVAFTAPMALLALGVVMLILIARQALVILLLVIAPLAFVAYILPNTESWFSKWRKAFIAVLMVYPVVGVIFGASTLASGILMAVAGDNGNTAGNTDDVNMLKVIALGVLAVPLFTVPSVLKGSLSAMGSLGGKIAGLQDRANGFSKRKIAGSRVGEAKGAFDARRQEKRVSRRMDPKAKRFGIPVGRMNTRLDNSKIGKYIGGDRGAAAATSAFHKMAGEEMDRQGATLTGTSVDELLEIAKDKTQSAERRGAALKRISEVGGHQHVQAAYDYLMTEGAKTGDSRDHAIKDVQQFAAESLLRRKPAGVGATTANALRTGSMAGDGVMEEFAQRLEAGKFDANALASMDVDDHVRIAQLAESGRIGQPTLDLIKAQMQEIQKSDTMSLTPEQQRVLNGALARQAPTRTNSQGGVEPSLVGLTAPTGTPSNNPATAPSSTSRQSGRTTVPFKGPTSKGNPSP